MNNQVSKTEVKIFVAACNVFLHYGFHGTKTQQIALEACVNKSLIHYYFRSKENLYLKVVEYLFHRVLNEQIILTSQEIAETSWFFTTEFYNNDQLFQKAAFRIYGSDFQIKILEIKNWMKTGITV